MNRHINHEQLTALEHHLRLEERESGTIEKYLRDVRSFATWLGERPLVKETASSLGRDESDLSAGGRGALQGVLHNLRHLFAKAFYRACCDVVQLADVLGHSSIETTRIYLASTCVEYIWRMDRLDLVC